MPITAEGVRTDGNPVPLWERETLTLPQAGAGCSTSITTACWSR